MIPHTASTRTDAVPPRRLCFAACQFALALLLVAFSPTAQSQQISQSVRFNPIGSEGPFGTLQVVARPRCMGGDVALHVGVTDATIEGVMIEGRRYTGSDVPGLQFPLSARRGNIHSRVQLRRPGLTLDIGDGVENVAAGGFMNVRFAAAGTQQWADTQLETCDDWTAWVLNTRLTTLSYVVTKTVGLGRDGSVLLEAKNNLRVERERVERERVERERQELPPTESRNGSTAAEERRQPESETGARARSDTRGQGASRPSSGTRAEQESDAARLSYNEQSRLRSTLADARQAERNGHYDVAIRLYQSAYGIDPLPWIPGKVDELRDSRRAKAEAEQERIEAGADAIATGAIVVGQALAPVMDEFWDGYDSKFRAGDNRQFEFELFRVGLGAVNNEYTFANRSGEPGRTTSFDGLELNVSSALAVNAWLPYKGASGRSLLGFRVSGRAGWANSTVLELEDEKTIGEDAPLFNESYINYTYGGGVVLNEMVSVGYENRTISTVDGEFDVVPLEQRTRHYGYVEVAPNYNRSMPLTLRVASALTGGCGEFGDWGGGACLATSGLNHVLVEARLPLANFSSFALTFERFERSIQATRSVLSATISMVLR